MIKSRLSETKEGFDCEQERSKIKPSNHHWHHNHQPDYAHCGTKSSPKDLQPRLLSASCPKITFPPSPRQWTVNPTGLSKGSMEG